MALKGPPTGSARTSYTPSSVSALSQGPTASSATTTTTQGTVPVPQELEQTLSALSSHRSVLGYLLIARGGLHSASIIRHSGVVFEGEKGRKYAGVIARIVENVQAGLEEVNSSGTAAVVGGSGGGSGTGIDESSEVDEVRFMRIRTKRHEIMISPDERFLLAVLHDPTVT